MSREEFTLIIGVKEDTGFISIDKLIFIYLPVKF
jgi:hypothetical protein